MPADPIRRLAIVHSDGSMTTLPLDTTLRQAAQEAAHIADVDGTQPTLSWLEIRVGEPLPTDHLLLEA